MAEKTIILGTGGHARAVLSILELNHDAEVIGFTTAKPTITSFAGYPVVGDDECLPAIRDQGARRFVVAVGSIGDSSLRESLYKYSLKLGLRPMNVVHPSSHIDPSASIGLGVTIMAGAIVSAGATVGDNTIINTAAVIEHDCVVEDHAHVATGACLGGNVRVGRGAHVGLGASILQGVVIGERAVIGAGAAVIRDVGAGKRVVGVPAREIGEEPPT